MILWQIISKKDFPIIDNQFKDHDKFYNHPSKSNGRRAYCGFHYFSYKDIYEMINGVGFWEKDLNIHLIVAFENEFSIENIVGVLKYAYYDNHIGLSYVDVREDYQHRGIGTKLLKFFDKQDFGEEEINVSFFSDECLKKGFQEKCFGTLKNHTYLYDYRLYTIKGSNKFYDIDKATEIENPWMIPLVKKGD